MEDNLSPSFLTSFSGNLTDLEEEDRDTISAKPDKDIQSDLEKEVVASEVLRLGAAGVEEEEAGLEAAADGSGLG